MKKVIMLLISLSISIMLFGCDSDDIKPTILVEQQIELNVGDVFEPLDYVLLTTDNSDENPTLTVETNTVDTSLPGDYVVIYKLQDEAGNYVIAQTSVTVITVENKFYNYLDDKLAKVGDLSIYTCNFGICESETEFLIMESGEARLTETTVTYQRANKTLKATLHNISTSPQFREREITFSLLTGTFIYTYELTYGFGDNLHDVSVRYEYNILDESSTCQFASTNQFDDETSYCVDTYINEFYTVIERLLDGANLSIEDFRQ